MTRKTLDPNLASILDSIRATVGGDAPLAHRPSNDPADEDPRPEGTADAVAAAPAAHPPAPPAGRTVEEFLADLIRPQVDQWLKTHLPEIIQTMAAEEIRRLTGK